MSTTARPAEPGSYREVWRLAHPAVLTLISQTIMWTIDSAMVGRVGKVELAAVGLGGIYIATLYSMFVGLTSSVNTFVAQAAGAGRHHQCGVYLKQGLYLAVVSGLVLLVVRHFSHDVVGLMRPAGEVQAPCVTYTMVRMLSAPFFLIQYTYSHFYRGIGDTVTPLKVLAFAHLLNIVGDYVLIFGAGPIAPMGVAGAAWATTLANLVAAATFAVLGFSRPIADRYDTRRDWRLRIHELRRLVRIGAPVALHYFLDMGSFLIFSAYVGRMGADALAASQVVIQVLALSFMPAQGLSVSATTLAGQYIGSGQHDIANRAVHRAMVIALLWAAVIAALCVGVPGLLVRIFNDDPTVVALGKRLLLLAAVFQVFDAIQFVAAGGLRGAGDTTIPAVLVVVCAWVIFVPGAYVLGTVMGYGVVGGWAGATLYISVVATLMWMRFKTGRWRDYQLNA